MLSRSRFFALVAAYFFGVVYTIVASRGRPESLVRPACDFGSRACMLGMMAFIIASTSPPPPLDFAVVHIIHAGAAAAARRTTSDTAMHTTTQPNMPSEAGWRCTPSGTSPRSRRRAATTQSATTAAAQSAITADCTIATAAVATTTVAAVAVAPAAPIRGRKTIGLQCSIGDVH